MRVSPVNREYGIKFENEKILEDNNFKKRDRFYILFN